MRNHHINNANLALLILLALAASDEDAECVMIERRLLEWLFEEWLRLKAEYSTREVRKTDNAAGERL
jgi:hypothetical protein